MIQKWKEATTANKVVLILQVVVSISIMVLALLQLLDISNTINIFIPLLGVNTLLQAIQELSKNRIYIYSVFCSITSIITDPSQTVR